MDALVATLAHSYLRSGQGQDDLLDCVNSRSWITMVETDSGMVSRYGIRDLFGTDAPVAICRLIIQHLGIYDLSP